MGYSRAGFEVVGVDINPQPHYPFEFHQLDVMDLMAPGVLRGWNWYGGGFNAIHASPPCQAFSITANLARAQGKRASEVDLLTPIRPLLEATGLPYIIENVKGAPLRDPLTLCGSTFGLGVRRHRLFESNVMLLGNGECRHQEQGRPIGIYYSIGDSIPKGGKTAESLEQGQAAMGIDWMTWKELREAIPPAYTEHLGRQLHAAIERAA